MKIIALISTLLVAAAVSAQQYSDTYMVCLVNRARAEAGLSPLGLDSALTQAAQRHSDDMASRNNMDHTGSDGSSPGDRCQAAGFQWTAVAENIAYGQSGADEVMQVWMDSPGHRENILNSQYTMMGSAVSSGGTPYYTQNFACDGGPAKNVPTCDGTEQAAAPSTGKQGNTSKSDRGSQSAGNYGGDDAQATTYSTGDEQSSGGGRRSGRRGRGSRSAGNGQMMSYGQGTMTGDDQWFSNQGFGQQPHMSGGGRGSHRAGGRARGGSFGGRGNGMMSGNSFGGGSFGGRSMGGGMDFGPLGTMGGGYY